MKNQAKYLEIIFLVIGFEFAKSGWEKLESGNFVTGLGGTLTKFASSNPYGFVKSFLEQVAIPNAAVFGQLTMWGEILAGLAILIGAGGLLIGKESKLIKLVLVKGLLIAAFLNLVFWLAAGYTSPSTAGLNMVMFAVEIIGSVYVVREMARGR